MKDGEQTAFRDALDRALTGKSQVEVARRAGIAPSTISTWLSGGGAKPAQVFAVENALSLRPGRLSRHLGYLPVGQRDDCDITEAIEADSELDRESKDAMLALYKALRKLLASS